MQLSRWERVRRIGQGSEGTCHLLQSKDTGKYLVRKMVTTFRMDGDLPREVKILRDKLDPHRHIVYLFDWAFEVDDNRHRSLSLLFEYYSGGDLSRYGSGGTEESFLWHVFRQMAEALAYLHHGYILNAPRGSWPPSRWQRVVHRDIKPDNIFLRKPRTLEDPYPDVVLGDFGFATLDPQTQSGGSILFQPPEFPDNSEFSDVWALGGTIHAMAHGRPPIDGIPHCYSGTQTDWYREKMARNPQALSKEYSRELNKNMMACLEIETDDRESSFDLFHRLRKDRRR